MVRRSYCGGWTLREESGGRCGGVWGVGDERVCACVCFTLVTIFDEIQREREWERCHA